MVCMTFGCKFMALFFLFWDQNEGSKLQIWTMLCYGNSASCGFRSQDLRDRKAAIEAFYYIRKFDFLVQ
jgi:hypothetical protein